VQIAPSTRKLPHREIEVVNIARQTGGIDGTSGSTADDPERVGSASWKNPRDGAQYANLVRRSRATSTHDQRDTRVLNVNCVRHDISDEVTSRVATPKRHSLVHHPLMHDGVVRSFS
jgi:hypothetical protein